MRRGTFVACVFLVCASCSYPEFRFVPEVADTTPGVTTDADETSIETDATADAADDAAVEVIDSTADVSETIATDSAPEVVDTAGTYLTLLARGGAWRYLDDGTVPSSSNWRGGGGFDDSKWKSGLAQLGYGDGDETTVIAEGAPDSGVAYTTYYFRRFITVTDAAAFDTVTIRLQRDDGAVVYFNGREVVRSNMPSGTITGTTLAAMTVSGADENVFYTYVVPAASLVEGANVIAVEVHQSGPGSSDVSFDLELTGHKP